MLYFFFSLFYVYSLTQTTNAWIKIMMTDRSFIAQDDEHSTQDSIASYTSCRSSS
ncbi:hypothetical protein KAZ93_02910 [Patescibacteria group bacterium]|nr:hypothetical protein [Patescibacteria group bacterium]